jgi:hypothetical protein
LDSVVVFREKPNGALVTAAPAFLPSTMNCTPAVFAETLVNTVMVPETVAPESGDVIEMVGAAELLTVTVTVELVVVCPVELLATAASEWLPLDSVVVFREKPNGALVTAMPVFLPSTMNCTPAVFVETLVDTVMVPETVAPESGDIIEMVGAAELLTATVTVELVVERPDRVLATAASEWLPLDSVVVFREKLNGALVTAAPAFLPSTMNCTPAVFAETLVDTVMAPETVAPESGDVIEMVGGRLLTLIEEVGLLADLPAELVATAATKCSPSNNLVVSSE